MRTKNGHKHYSLFVCLWLLFGRYSIIIVDSCGGLIVGIYLFICLMFASNKYQHDNGFHSRPRMDVAHSHVSVGVFFVHEYNNVNEE